MFNNIIGHEDKKTYFENIINKKNISHSYLFYGDEGIGKLTFAKQLSKALLKVDNLDSCVDYKYISKNDDKKNILVEQIRKELIDDIYIRPILGDYKVYIIDNANYLNIAAQNAILKTLEEPPKYVVIFMITSNINSMLTTILSRTSKVYFNNIENQKIIKYAKDEFKLDLSSNIIDYINGSIGKLRKIVEEKLLDKFLLVDKLADIIIKKETINAFNMAQEINFLDNNIIEYFENIMYNINKYEAIKYIEKSALRLKNNGNYDIVVDNMILKIIDVI